jgi:hypothetical protein
MVGAIDSLRRRQRELWVAAVLLYGVGDGVTTAIGTEAADVAEAGPVAAAFLEGAGVDGIVLLKVVLFGVSFAVWWAITTPGRVAVPLSLAVVGAVVTAWNLHVLFL